MYQRTALIEEKLEAAGDHIKSQLSAAGYRLTQEKRVAREGARQWTLEHIRGAQRVVTYLVEIEGGATAVVQRCDGCVGDSAGAVKLRSRTGGGEANCNRGLWRCVQCFRPTAPAQVPSAIQSLKPCFGT